MSEEISKKVLLVDDENDVGLMFKRILQRNGIVVDFFSNPLDALDKFKPNYYDLAILDIKMPEMNGTQLYIELRKLDQKIPICFISAYEMTIDELRRILPDYITNCLMKKPVSNDLLVARVQEVLARV